MKTTKMEHKPDRGLMILFAYTIRCVCVGWPGQTD